MFPQALVLAAAERGYASELPLTADRRLGARRAVVVRAVAARIVTLQRLALRSRVPPCSRASWRDGEVVRVRFGGTPGGVGRGGWLGTCSIYEHRCGGGIYGLELECVADVAFVFSRSLKIIAGSAHICRAFHVWNGGRRCCGPSVQVGLGSSRSAIHKSSCVSTSRAHGHPHQLHAGRHTPKSGHALRVSLLLAFGCQCMYGSTCLQRCEYES